MRTLKKGDRGGDVIILQRKLGIKVTGMFDKNTELAVVVFQHKNGLEVNGIVGFRMWDLLYHPKDSKKKWYEVFTRYIIKR